jgi:hypothetical protein
MKEIFCDEEVLQAFDEDNQTMILKEEDNNQYITIGGIPKDAILLKLDVDKIGYKQKSKYLRRGVTFIHKGCDYCLVMPTQNLILLFELKSLKPKEKNYIEQFVASEIFITYCKNLHDYKNKLISNYTFKRVLLSTKYNYGLTNNSVIDISKVDNYGNTISIITPGFPPRIRLEKLLK